MEFEINKLYFDTLLNRKMKKIFLPTLTLNFVLFAGLTAALSKKSKDIILISKELEVSIGHGEAAAGVRKWTIDV